MNTSYKPSLCSHRFGAHGVTLAELLVVLGIIALLISIVLPPLSIAHKQALSTRCAAQQQQIGIAATNCKNEYDFYPLWDDDGAPVRYTWLDVFIQRRLLSSARAAYCPEDPRPPAINAARAEHFQLRYPGDLNHFGIDYSYGISVPLSAGGWAWRSGFGSGGDDRPRRLEDHERYPSRRVLSADSNWSAVYNLSGDALYAHDWSYPTQYDNTVDWRHHGLRANLLFQDGHVALIRFHYGARNPIDTVRQFVWHPGESMYVGPDYSYRGNFYPCVPPVDASNSASSGLFPAEMVPGYYTQNMLWTHIHHK